MKPKLVMRGGEWLCVGGTVVGRGDDMNAAYRRWYSLRCLES